jgi:glutamate:GABA antiporter
MAMAAVERDLLDTTTTDALEEKKKLRKHFARFDILFFLICTLVGVDTLGAVASNGPQAFTWLIFLAVLFFVPYALLTAELGSAFPEEGGPYIWTRLAFGRGVAAVNAVIYWVSNPIWVGGTLGITALAACEEFFNGGNPLPGPKILGGATLLDVLFVLAFIWFAVIAAIISFRIGKWVPTIGAFVRTAVLGFFTISVVIYAVKHGVHGTFGGGKFLPSYAVFIAAVPVLIFNYVGFELPSAAGEEMKNPQRDVPISVARSAVGTVLLYGLPILSILLLLPARQVTGLGGFLAAIKSVFTVYGGHIAANGTPVLTGAGQALGYLMAIAFILALLSSGTTWIMGADRAQAMAALDGAAPRILGRFSVRFGTPIAVNLLSGIVATAVMVLAFAITGGNALKYFTVVLGLVISTTTIAYIVIFPALIKLRHSHPHVPRPYLIPGGKPVAWIVGCLCTFWAVFATIVLVYPGIGTNWFGQHGNPDSALPAGFTRGQFEKSQFIPLAVLLVIGILFYVAGAPTRRHAVQVSIAQEMGIGEAGMPLGGANAARSSGAGYPATADQDGPATADPTSIPEEGP